jgi:hypothetical protein
METAPDLKLSPSEKWTLQKIAEGEYHLRELDWVALQHLKKLALAEDRPSGVAIGQSPSSLRWSRSVRTGSCSAARNAQGGRPHGMKVAD